MESLEIFQENNESGNWVVEHNGRRVYATDAQHLSALMSWVRMQYAEFGTAFIAIQPRS